MNEIINQKDNYEPNKRVVIKTGKDSYQSILVSDISFAFEQWHNRIEELNKVRYLAGDALHKGMGVPMDDLRFHRRMFAAEILKIIDGEK